MEVTVGNVQQEWSWCEKCGHCTTHQTLEPQPDIHPLAHFIASYICFMIRRLGEGSTPGEATAEALNTSSTVLQYASRVPVGSC